MTNNSFWTRLWRRRRIRRISPRVIPPIFAIIMACAPVFAANGQAPPWMHALVNAPVPVHDEKTDAVSLYSEQTLTVISADKFRVTYREAYKILRPEGRRHRRVDIDFDSLRDKVSGIHAWCIPAQGKDYEIGEKDVIDRGFLKDESISLMTSERLKILLIPAADPGNIIGYEYVEDERPQWLQDFWGLQEDVPVRESRYSLKLPPGWTSKVAWFNYPEVKPQNAGDGLWQWTAGDIKEFREEKQMPPIRGVAGLAVVTLIPPGDSTAPNLSNWRDVGDWYRQKSNGRLVASPEIKQQVRTLTASAPTTLDKMRALAEFMQRNFRYVQISMKIGGFIPHSATEVFANRFGDCKDKVTLLQSMLGEIGVDSFMVLTNIDRDSVTPETPPHVGSFDHAIIAIKLPDGLSDPSLIATLKHPTLGTLLIFDPTNEKTPFGQIGGYLQANYSLLAAPSGGEMVKLPLQPSSMSGRERTGKLTLSASGDLQGDVVETNVGDPAWVERMIYIQAEKSFDKIKHVESLLAGSLSMFKITRASISNPDVSNNPFIWNYSFQAEKYAKQVGSLMLVRPRVLGSDSSNLLETSEPRRFAVEFKGPVLNTDTFEITLPPGYVVDALPPPVDSDFAFATYHSKTEVVGNVLRYHRTFEQKEVSVPLSQVSDLKKFYRIIALDERNTAVLKLVAMP